ncbi:hypothetical protein IKE99_01440 [Candidatus Saccharibacteria bacterium]|nr:hypothetical protein [Candidatus Saccharibacteria bacterium]
MFNPNATPTSGGETNGRAGNRARGESVGAAERAEREREERLNGLYKELEAAGGDWEKCASIIEQIEQIEKAQAPASNPEPAPSATPSQPEGDPSGTASGESTSGPEADPSGRSAEQTGAAAKRNKGFKNFLKQYGAPAVMVALAGIATLVAVKFNKSNEGAEAKAAIETESEAPVETEFETELNISSADELAAQIGAEQWTSEKELTGYEVLDASIDGSYLQYDNIGCYNAEGKVSDHAVGNPDAVLEAMGINPEEATAEQRGDVQEFFAYSMKEPAAAVAIAGSFEGFEGLSQAEAEEKIKNMSPEEKLKFQEAQKAFFDNTTYHYETGNGKYHNMGVIEDESGEKHGRYVESDLTGKEILVSETQVNDVSVHWVSKEDCGNPTDQLFVHHSDGTVAIVEIKEGERATNKTEKKETEQQSETRQSESETRQSETSTGTPVITTPVNTNTPSETTPVEQSKPKKEEKQETEKPKQPETPAQTEAQPQSETLAPKDAENAVRIDQEIQQDIAEDVGTNEVHVEQAQPVTPEQVTPEPVATGETAAQIVTNEAAAPAATAETSAAAPAAQPETPAPVVQEAPANDYSANIAPEPEYTVAPDTSAQAAADEAAIPVEAAPVDNVEVSDALADLGIQ